MYGIFVFLLPLSGFLAVIITIAFCFWFEGAWSDQYLRTALLAAVALTIFCENILCGQIMEDISNEEYKHLLSVEWYDWNETNKKIYLMLLINSTKPTRIQFSDNIAFNYNLGVSGIKTIISGISILIRLKK